MTTQKDNQGPLLTNDLAMDMKDDEVKRLKNFFRDTNAPYNGSAASSLAMKLVEWAKLHGKDEYSVTVRLIDSYFDHYRTQK